MSLIAFIFLFFCFAGPDRIDLDLQRSSSIKVQTLELGMDEDPVLSDQLPIEIHLTPSVFGALDLHQVPVYGRAVAIVTILIGISRSEVD